MEEPSVFPHRVTQLLQQWSQGDDSALAELTPLVHYMEGERPGHTLQTTALVDEAYLCLADQTNPNWQSRAHFFAVALVRCVKFWSVTLGATERKNAVAAERRSQA
jgi:ECF sigma factor